jgi:hypothetical protein
LNAPPFKNNEIPEKFSDSTYLAFFKRIFGWFQSHIQFRKQQYSLRIRLRHPLDPLLSLSLSPVAGYNHA